MLTKRVAVILAGGKSRRFGSDKACARLGTQTFLQRLDGLLKWAGFQVILSVDHPKKFKFPSPLVGLPSGGQGEGVGEGKMGPNVMVKDALPGAGPLHAIYNLLRQVRYDYCLVVACDMPFLKQEVVELLWKKRKGGDLTLLECYSSWFPLPGVYSSSLLPQMKKLLSRRRYDLKALWECPITTRVLPFSHWRTADPKGASLININTPEEYREHVLRVG